MFDTRLRAHFLIKKAPLFVCFIFFYYLCSRIT